MPHDEQSGLLSPSSRARYCFIAKELAPKKETKEPVPGGQAVLVR